MAKTITDANSGKAVEEIIADRYDKVVRHYQDPTVTDKASTITLKVKITPVATIGTRSQFKVEVTDSTTLAGYRGFEEQVFSEVDDDGNVRTIPFQLPLERVTG